MKKQKTSTPKQTKSDPAKLSYAERKEFNKLEKEIEELEIRKQAIEDEMNSGITDYEKLNELSNQFGEIKDEIEEKELLWLELSERA